MASKLSNAAFVSTDSWKSWWRRGEHCHRYVVGLRFLSSRTVIIFVSSLEQPAAELAELLLA
jgi:hypothetical protein